jgi:antitoxin component YwqK of YwqJK toxin-antitoxin module
MLLILCLTTPVLKAQDTTKTNPLFEKFHWTEKKPGEFEITVEGYDSIRKLNNEFQNFFYTTVDKPDGKLTVRDENGKKVRECRYKNKLMFDEQWWYPTGEKEFEGTWSETTNEYGDQMLDEYKWYYKNKKVRKHGLRNGVTTTYYEDGQVESEKTFRDGKANGMYKSYYPNGKLQTTGNYFDGNKVGEWVEYNPDGTERERGH